MTLPDCISWPECLHCGEPVTELQQAAMRYVVFEGAGIVHSKCIMAALVDIERQMVTS